MARTKPPKKILERKRRERIRKATQEGNLEQLRIEGGIRNFGGFLIDPADRCPWPRKADDGAIWTDLGCCLAHCKDHCKRYLRFKMMAPIMRNRDLRRRGVNISMHPDDPEHPDYERRQAEKLKKEMLKKKGRDENKAAKK